MAIDSGLQDEKMYSFFGRRRVASAALNRYIEAEVRLIVVVVMDALIG